MRFTRSSRRGGLTVAGEDLASRSQLSQRVAEEVREAVSDEDLRELLRSAIARGFTHRVRLDRRQRWLDANERGLRTAQALRRLPCLMPEVSPWNPQYDRVRVELNGVWTLISRAWLA